MKHKVIVISLGFLIVITSSTLLAHGKEIHKKSTLESKQDVKNVLKNKTESEVWNFVDLSIKDLAKELQAMNYKQSKQELVRLKKSLDILKKKIAVEKKEEPSHKIKKGHDDTHHEHNMGAIK